MTLPDVKHLEQYFGPWAMYEPHFDGLRSAIKTTDLIAHVADSHRAKQELPKGVQPKPVAYTVTPEGVAVVEISGTMTKHGTSFNSSMPFGTQGVIKSIQSAVRDPAVSGIVLRIESGGGSTMGTSDLADTVAAAAKKKPTIAYIDDIGASAAYWAASQASEIIAGKTALAGSIGTYMVVYDSSAAAELEGVKVHVIRAGDHKGAGMDGTEITEDQLANFQREVNEINAHFIAGVAKGRGMTKAQVEAIADGRIHVGDKARTLGLVDRIGTMQDAINAVRSAAAKTKTSIKENRTMEDTNEMGNAAPRPATLAEIKAACPEADNDFMVRQLEANATERQAANAWMKELSARNKATEAKAKAADEALAQAKADAESKAQRFASLPGVAAVGEGNFGASAGHASGDPMSEWNAAVEAVMKSNPNMSRESATVRVSRENEDLRSAFVEHMNLNPPKKAHRELARR